MEFWFLTDKLTQCNFLQATELSLVVQLGQMDTMLYKLMMTKDWASQQFPVIKWGDNEI